MVKGAVHIEYTVSVILTIVRCLFHAFLYDFELLTFATKDTCNSLQYPHRRPPRYILPLQFVQNITHNNAVVYAGVGIIWIVCTLRWIRTSLLIHESWASGLGPSSYNISKQYSRYIVIYNSKLLMMYMHVGLIDMLCFRNYTYSVKLEVKAAFGKLTSNMVSLASYNSLTTVDVITVSANLYNMSERTVSDTILGPWK